MVVSTKNMKSLNVLYSKPVHFYMLCSLHVPGATLDGVNKSQGEDGSGMSGIYIVDL